MTVAKKHAPAPSPARKAPAKAAPIAKAAKTPKAAGPSRAAKPVVPPKAAKALPPKPAEPSMKAKEKLIRDSFTIPKDEYALLQQLKQRALRLARPAKKSELLRAGIAALAAMPDDVFLAGLTRVPMLKTGRPKRS